jgi:hypothetical protein
MGIKATSIVKISTLPMVIAAAVNHLYAMGIVTFIMPVVTPLARVESAEPISNIEFSKETPKFDDKKSNMKKVAKRARFFQNGLTAGESDEVVEKKSELIGKKKTTMFIVIFCFAVCFSF